MFYSGREIGQRASARYKKTARGVNSGAVENPLLPKGQSTKEIVFEAMAQTMIWVKI
jgi:hypothetical protein